jgi:hypothetical protein
MKISGQLISSFLLYSCLANTTKPPGAKTVEYRLNYEPRKVKLEGLLYKKSFPGPPNYQDIESGDEEEVYWLIKTAKPFCVNKSSYVEGDELHDLSEVQLVVSSELDFYKTKRSFINKKIKVQGTLFPQISGHHKTEVLLIVESLEKADE